MGSSATIRLIGRIQSGDVPELKEQLANAGAKVTLDLDEVTLVDVDVVRFLGACQAEGTEVLRCSPYIREWMFRERGRERPEAAGTIR